MQMLIFTGPAGTTAATAAATAAAAAAGGARTLLASVGPSHPTAALTGAAPGPEPHSVAPNLDAWLLDPLADMSAIWGALPNVAGQVAGDELPVIPGSDLFLAVSRLRAFAPRYDLACVDAGPPDALLRALGVPDTFRWMVRLLLGLDRGPGRSPASVARAVVPVGLIPFPMEWTGNLQDARVRLEQLRDETVDPASARVRYVLRPDPAGLAEARVAIPALQLFGLAVESLVAGPLLDPGLRRHGLAALLDEQESALAEAAATWPARPRLRLPAAPAPASPAGLAALGDALYGGASPRPAGAIAPPVRLGGPPEPQVALDLPGLPREALGLTLSGDELIVRAGPYRRHILLPDGLRGVTAIKAAKQGDTLTVRPRT
jgi:anion-transporting  ArsA/GET3 family ATPase